MHRTGVFVCWCGSNIASTVDVVKVTESLKSVDGVVHAAEYQYMCSESGQAMVQQAIKEHQLDGVVVCSCSPRMHEATFRKAAKAAGLNPFMVEIANIREHCSWIHKDKETGTEKAIQLGKAAIAKVKANTPLIAGESNVVKRALVIGGGIAGLQTALDIAEAGYQVDVVEKTPSIGGKMAQLDKTFPTLDCSACILTPKMVDASAHENITLHTYSEVESVSGFVGNFTVNIRKKSRGVSKDRCSGCGICTEKCPSRSQKSEFDEGLRNRGAIYIPFAQAIPNVPVIDREVCLKYTKDKCGICKKVCPADAIEFEQEDEIITERYGAIVAATGYDVISLENFGEYQHGENPDVITSLEFERLTNAAGPTSGKLVRLSNHEKPKTIVFVQCVGSRDTSERGKPYCSKICCMYTAKHAMLVKEKYPDIETYVFYIDVRTPGKNFDEFYRRAVEEYGVKYIKGMVGKVTEDNGRLMVHASDLINNQPLKINADMVVLAAAVEADPTAKKLAGMLTASIDTNNFLTEAHPKLRPVESPTAGIFLSGVCQGPKDIPETVAQAGAAAVKVIGLLAKDKLVNNPCVALVDDHICSGCSACEAVCPYGAVTVEKREVNNHGVKETRLISQVNEVICQGCGACTVACPSGAMDLKGFSNRQIMAEVDAICQ